jgi:pimeloyl-ACP methyl ester carboxylesterase
MLAKLGFDVWIGNNRGNRVSKDENNNDAEYWAYNFDHLVEYDQPAIIEGVLRETGKEKVIYLGHSQGSTQFLLGLGVHRELSCKIAAFIGLGTVVSLQNVE